MFLGGARPFGLGLLAPPGIKTAERWKTAQYRYKIERKLGEGAYGRAYLVSDRDMLQPGVSKVAQDRESAAGFTAEAGALWKLIGLPGIPGLIESGKDYFVTEFVVGKSLDQIVFGRPKLAISERLCLARTIADIMSKVHEQGIVHADLKPENILATDDGLVILDFGAAFEHGEAPYPPGEPLGTEPYMSPEQIMGAWEHVNEPTDVYALGVMIYEFLTGRLPFDPDKELPELQQEVLTQPPIRPSSYARIPKKVDDLVCRMLAKDYARRPTMAQVKRALAQYAVKCPWLR